jgi:tetratricopeptide (TPR) repeat protein
LAIKLNPNYAEAFANRGNVQRHFGRHDMALLDYDAALRNGHPRAAFVFTWQGMALEAQGRRREAMDAFRRALSIDPNLALAKSNLARLEVGQQMSSVLGRKKVAKGPITPLVLTATPGSAPVAANENIQLTQWTPPTAPEPPAMKDPVVSPAVAPAPAPAPTASARNAVSLRPAFDDHPPALPAVAAAPAPAPVKPTAPVVTAIRPVANGEGGSDIAFAIQLGSFKSPELAEAGWAKALKVAGDLLNGLSHAVETVTVTEGTVYRLFAEALPDRKAALGLCRTLRDKGTPCIVVRR